MGIMDSPLLRWLRKPDPRQSARARARAGHPPSPTHQTQFAHSQTAAPSGTPAVTQHTMRKDLLKVVLRETLMRNGIPMRWVGADLLRATSPKREAGIHVRLLVRHWDPRLQMCAVALEQNFFRRLLAMDPQAADWLMGISWQYAMEDLSACPALPHPGSWTAATDQPLPQVPPRPAGAPVIEGPVHIAAPGADVRGDLDRMLAARDAKAGAPPASDSFAVTQPIQL